MANTASTPPLCRLCGAAHWQRDPHLFGKGQSGLSVDAILGKGPTIKPRPLILPGKVAAHETSERLPSMPTDWAEVDGVLTVDVPDGVTMVRIVWADGRMKDVHPAKRDRAAYMAARRGKAPPGIAD